MREWTARFFGVVTRPLTWLTVLYHWLAFPLGLFYFIFLVVGLSLGLGLVVIWVGIIILLLVAGAWWLFAAFERAQARYLLGAHVEPAPRPWETADGVWARLKAHFGAGSTWKDLLFLLAKLPFGVVSFALATTALATVALLLSTPIAAYFHIQLVTGDAPGSGWVPTWWQAVICVPGGVLALVAWLHVLNAWGWVCARWAELLFNDRTPRVLEVNDEK